VALIVIILAKSKGYKIVRGKREFLNGESHTFCSSPNSIRLVKSDRMRLARHVAGIKFMKNSYRIPATKPPRTKTHWETSAWIEY
jgi:hypothetical protein